MKKVVNTILVIIAIGMMSTLIPLLVLYSGQSWLIGLALGGAIVMFNRRNVAGKTTGVALLITTAIIFFMTSNVQWHILIASAISVPILALLIVIFKKRRTANMLLILIVMLVIFINILWIVNTPFSHKNEIDLSLKYDPYSDMENKDEQEKEQILEEEVEDIKEEEELQIEEEQAEEEQPEVKEQEEPKPQVIVKNYYHKAKEIVREVIKEQPAPVAQTPPAQVIESQPVQAQAEPVIPEPVQTIVPQPTPEPYSNRGPGVYTGDVSNSQSYSPYTSNRGPGVYTGDVSGGYDNQYTGDIYGNSYITIFADTTNVRVGQTCTFTVQGVSSINRNMIEGFDSRTMTYYQGGNNSFSIKFNAPGAYFLNYVGSNSEIHISVSP